MEIQEQVVIVGAGVAGLATCLGLHRLGIRSLVLESAEGLRVTGFAFSFWSNAWKALEALGIADAVREKHDRIQSFVTASTTTGLQVAEVKLPSLSGTEMRCVNRKIILEIIEKELPRDAIRFSSKLVGIQADGPINYLHLADGTIIKTRVAIGADGVNSAVAKFLGFSKPVSSGRFAIRGFIIDDGHGFHAKFMQFLGNGMRYGILPANDHSLYWFCVYTPSSKDEQEMEHDPARLKEFALNRLGKVPQNVRQVFEKTDQKNIICTELKFRHPWELLLVSVCKDNVIVIGDALHPMTPDLGQGACCALEDSVELARSLGEALKDNNEDERIRKGLEKFANARRWRSFFIISLGYLIGRLQQGGGVVINYVREKFLAKILLPVMFSKTGYDCGKLPSP